MLQLLKWQKKHEVVLWRRDTQALQELSAAGHIEGKDYQGTRSVTVGFENSQINLVSDLEQAIEFSDLVVIRCLQPHMKI